MRTTDAESGEELQIQESVAGVQELQNGELARKLQRHSRSRLLASNRVSTAYHDRPTLTESAIELKATASFIKFCNS